MKEIELGKQAYKRKNKYVALVDDEDFDILNSYRWYARKNGNIYYAYRHEIGTRKQIAMHRQILNYPVGVHIDHKDRNGLNNQKYNIRICTSADNQHNKIGWGKSGFKGVYIRKYKENIRYRAIIQIETKIKHLGYFDTPEQAAIAYDNAARLYFKEFARTNF